MKNKRMKKVKFNYVTMLKAVSLLAVSIYHLFSHRLSGGFLGVIIFMIISGFFLAKSSTKTYDLVEVKFFIDKIKARLFKIISPMWSIIAISLLVSLIFARDIFDDSVRSSLATMFAYENIRAIVKGISYFDRSGNFNIFTHLWYIAVYLQYILIYYLLDYLINKLNLNAFRIYIFGGLSILSIILSYYLSFTKASVIRIYYGTDVRLSAFFLGSVSYLAYEKWGTLLDRLTRKKTSLLLFLAIILPFFFIDGKSLWVYRTFFLIYQLLVCLFLAFIYKLEVDNPIRYRDHNPFFKFMIWLGDRSYYYYLWQYIVQIFMLYLFRNKISSKAIFYLVELGILVILSELSYSLRRMKKSYKIKKLAIALALVGILNATSLVIGNKKEAQMEEFKKEFAKNELEIKKRNAEAKKNTNKKKKDDKLKEEKKEESPNKGGNFEEKAYDDFNFTDKEKEYLKNISITAIGDSVLVNIDSYLRSLVPNLYLDGLVGRNMWDGPDTLNNVKASNGLNDIILVVLGSNGFKSTDDMQAIVDEADGRDVYFVNTSHLQSYMDQVNDQIKSFTDKNPKAHLVDWRAFIKDKENLLAVDKVHPNVEGSDDFAKLVCRKILNVNKVRP
ncbi:acyltransferase family protein [Anaerococcus tetradius]|uniref:Acyltransferase n=1 Tax=Anaerococcus tetradius ATCC 35098 TaxID=525255 RepID=C2CGL3_9FIRM|nr:acyltransferase family protein [Anaerococcus tetradius]EEI83277.1 acyltransferase [Anaerococcus tetradius ATCC 35098]